MRKFDVYLSSSEPIAKNCLWLKPVEGGFAGYILNNGKWEPMKLVDDKNTSVTSDDTKEDASTIKAAVIGTAQDAKTANTINGAKKYAADQASTLLGTSSDTSADMTLYGLKAYIDSKTE